VSANQSMLDWLLSTGGHAEYRQNKCRI